MVNLKALNKAIKDNSTVEVAKENLEIELESAKDREKIRKYMRDLGIGSY